MGIEILRIFVFSTFLGAIFLIVDTTTLFTTANRRQLPRVLIGREFKLESKVKIVRDKSSGIDEEITLTEYYSNEQQKAKLVFHDLNENDPVDGDAYYYYDTSVFSEKQLIKIIDSPSINDVNCELIDLKKFTNQLFGSLSSYDERLTGLDWLKEREDVPDYVIGFARLLFIVESNKDKLIHDAEQESPEIRNHKTKKYKLEINLTRDKPSTIRVFYALDNEQSDLALRVLLTLPNGSEVMVDYLAMKQLKEQGFLKRTDGVDLFTYPPRKECASKLKPSSLFSISSFQAPKVFSFETEIIEMGHHDFEDRGEIGSLGKYFIAYDGYVKLLRVDSTVKTYSLNEEEYSTSVYVPRRNRKFNVRSLIVEQQITIKDGFLEDKQETKRHQTMSNCASSKISVDGQSQYIFAEPLIPFSKLTQIGRGQVRGVECIVFEAIERLDLPRIFFPPVSYYGDGGARLVQDNTKRRGSKDGGQMKYQTIYYFSIQEELGTSRLPLGNEQQLGPLMRIDLLKPGGGIVYRIEVINFAWTLSDAPNGDRQDELFSLNEKCSNLNNKLEDRYADLAMNLEFKSTVGNDKEIEPNSSEDLKSVIELLESPEVRNLALVRAISEDSNLILTQMHEFRSNLHPVLFATKPKLFIRIEAKLGNQVFDLYEATKIGNGILDGSDVSFARNFDECFWDAAHQRRQRSHILFSFCYSVCTIDQRPFNGKKSDTNVGSFPLNDDNDDAVFLDPNSSCEILRMDMKQQDKPAIDLMSKFWTTFYRGLRGLKLLAFVESGQKETRLGFLVNQIDVYNNKWTNLQREPIFKPISSETSNNEVLKGLALSLEDGSTKRVRLRDQIIHRFEMGKDNSLVERMNFDLCHSSCIANITCRSYSVCYSGRKIHCLISNLKFKDKELLDRIAEKIGELKAAGRNKGPINVDFHSTIEEGDKTNSDEKSSKMVETHELWVDSRCQTYTKYALEMFTQSKKVFSRLRNKYVLPVESENHCAELCLKQNINFFKRIAKFKLRYLESSDQNYLSKMLRQQNADIRSWCSAFRFLNLATSTPPVSVRINLRPSKLANNGLCTLIGPNWIKKDDKEKNQDLNWDNKDDSQQNKTGYSEQLVAMQSYEFSYSMLYERHYGIRLLAKHVPEEDNDYLIDAQLNSNNQFVLDNKQNDIEFCARACFSQTVGLEPWCKSFEYVEDKSLFTTGSSKFNRLKEKVKSYCVFNSMSLNDILQMKSPRTFVDTNLGPDLTVWHFELRNSYTLDDMISSRLILNENLDFYYENRSQRLGTLGIIIIMLISLISGLLLGTLIGTKLLSERVVSGGRRESVENPSRSFLNSLISGISGNPNDVSHRRFESDIDLLDLPELAVGADARPAPL